MSVEQRDEEYVITDVVAEGAVISKGHVIRHFQKLHPDLIIVSTSEFKMQWETQTVKCRFGVKPKYVEDTVSKEKFLEIMETNSNLMRDLEAAKEKIAELESPRISQCTEAEVKACYAKYYESKEPEMEISQDVDCKPVDGFIAGSKTEKGINPIVKYDEDFATTQETLMGAKDGEAIAVSDGTLKALQETLEISSIEAASPVEEKTRADLSDEELDDGK
jgi:hypothetical protein